MPSARRSISAHVNRRSPWTWPGASGRWSATHSQMSAKFHPFRTRPTVHRARDGPAA